MKIKAVTYTDDEELETITVVMSLREATALHAIAGKLNWHAQSKLGLVPTWGDGTAAASPEGDDSLYDAIDRLFNGHWEDGEPPNTPKIDLETLNDAPPGDEP